MVHRVADVEEVAQPRVDSLALQPDRVRDSVCGLVKPRARLSRIERVEPARDVYWQAQPTLHPRYCNLNPPARLERGGRAALAGAGAAAVHLARVVLSLSEQRSAAMSHHPTGDK